MNWERQRQRRKAGRWRREKRRKGKRKEGRKEGDSEGPCVCLQLTRTKPAILRPYFLTKSVLLCQASFPFPLCFRQFLCSFTGVPQDSSKTWFNYFSKKKGGGRECKHDSFLSPDTSGQVDNVLKQNKSALTVTSKSSARGLQLLPAQECCC